MILVDTSVWVDHFRKYDRKIVDMLEQRQILTHAHVIGEIMLGQFADRRLIRELFLNLETCAVASQGEILDFIESLKLFGRGIGLVDVHLLAAARLSSAKLLTHDKRLREVASDLGLNAVI